MVDPTNLKPRFFRSTLMASDSGVLAGMSFKLRRRLIIGLPPTNRHMYLSNEPNSLRTCRKGFALLTAARIFSRFRIIPASFNRALIFLLENHETFCGSKFANERP